MNRKIVYIAHPLGDGADRAKNCERAAKWASWAANQGAAPVCTWIVLASQWDESRRQDGLEVDCTLIERCDEVWLCGPRISPGMHVEATHARKHGVLVRVLVSPLYVEGPPLRAMTADDIEQDSKPVPDKVRAKIERMASHHGYTYEDFLKLSQLQVLMLEAESPTPRSEPSESSEVEHSQRSSPLEDKAP